MMTDQQIRQFAEFVLAGGARPAMANTIGDRRPASYDKADKIAEGILSGVRYAAQEMGAIIAPEMNSMPADDIKGVFFEAAAFGRDGDTAILCLWREGKRYVLVLNDQGTFEPLSPDDGHDLADLLTTLVR